MSRTNQDLKEKEQRDRCGLAETRLPQVLFLHERNNKSAVSSIRTLPFASLEDSSHLGKSAMKPEGRYMELQQLLSNENKLAVLQFLIDSGQLDFGSAEEEMRKSEMKKAIKQHPYKIYQASKEDCQAASLQDL